MKTSAIARIIIWTLTALLLTSLLIFGLCSNGIFGFSFGRSGDYTYGAAAIDASQIDDVQVEWISGDITITESTDGTIAFSETSSRALDEEDQLGYRIDGRKLTIVQTDQSYWFGSAPSKDLQLSLPAELAELSLETVSADVTMEGQFTIDTVEMETVSGRLEIAELNCREISLDSVSGRMELTVGTAAPKKVEVDAVSADVTLYWPEEFGFTAEMEAVSGNTSSDFSTTSSNDRLIYGDGASQIECESVSGDLDIRKK